MGGLGEDVRRWGGWVVAHLPVIALTLAVTAALALGVYAVGDALSIWVAIAIGAVVVVAVWRRSWFDRALVALRVLLAVLVAFLALAGVDVLLNALEIHLPTLVGILLALIVFGLAAYWYLNRLGWGWRRRYAIATAAGLSLLVIVGTPLVVAWFKAGSDRVAVAKPISAKLDVLIVDNGKHLPAAARLPLNPGLHGFNVSFSVGYATKDGARWTLANEECPQESSEECANVALEAVAAGRDHPLAVEPPRHREGADTVLLLLVDGTAPVVLDPAHLRDQPFRRGEVGRWKRIAAGAAPAGTPTFALLQTRSPARLAHWKPEAGRVTAVSAQGLESKTVTDAAARLAIAAPSSQADFGLALKFRPVLLFDEAEPVPWPLSVDALFNEHRVRLCHDEGELSTTCGEALAGPEELENGGTHLKLELRKGPELRKLAKEQLRAEEEAPAQPQKALPAATGVPAATPPAGVTERLPGAEDATGAGSTIYVHPVPVNHDHREILLLDYWWYLPDNPVSLGGGALCGAGMVIEGITCDNHVSDWEGVTVVVDRTSGHPHVVAVHYAQHNKVVRYGWPLLHRRWSHDPAIKPLVAKIADASTRPLVFVAEGTHASYPTPCAGCDQISDPDLKEEPHRGGLRWVGDDSGACGRSNCVQMLPTHEGGRQPALWNAYEGTWGKHHCVLSYYCDSSSPPTAPGQQKRYRNPALYSGVVTRNWRFLAVPGED